MKKQRSYSAQGRILERVFEKGVYSPSDEQLNQILHTTKKLELRVRSSVQPKPSMDKLTSRDKISPFQSCHTYQNHQQLKYQPKQDFVLKRSASLPFPKDSTPRLNNLIPSCSPQDVKRCSRLKEQQPSNAMTVRDLHKHRQEWHSLDFRNQTARPFNVELEKIANEENLTGRLSKYPLHNPEPIGSPEKAHAFSSYTKRDFNFNGAVRTQAGDSGNAAFKVPLEKFKGNWHTISQVSFEKVPSKQISRYDRDCPLWMKKLSYEKPENKPAAAVNFEKQTNRRVNEVHSQYPIRIAI